MRPRAGFFNAEPIDPRRCLNERMDSPLDSHAAGCDNNQMKPTLLAIGLIFCIAVAGWALPVEESEKPPMPPQSQNKPMPEDPKPPSSLLPKAVQAGQKAIDAAKAKLPAVPMPPIRPVVGPLVGHVTHDSVKLWMWAGRAADYQVLYWPATASETQALAPVSMAADEAQNWVARTTLTGLTPGTEYHFRISVDGKFDPLWTGGFRTAPRDGDPSRFRMAVSSCMRPEFANHSSWYLLLLQKPDFQLLLGDNIYADTTNIQKLWKHYLSMRSVPEFAATLRSMPTWAIWDDHDFGPNNSDGTLRGKGDSLSVFRHVWANPAAGVPAVPDGQGGMKPGISGAFFKFTYGQVEFFMLDGRYHRSPNVEKDGPDKTMLGHEQMAWLTEGLKGSTAKFKVLASGSTFMHSKSDGWRSFPTARKVLLNTIADHRIAGVLYLSGDIHESLIDTHPAAATGGYPLTEVISSGIANSKTRSFATIDFDTLAADSTAHIRILHGDGTVRQEKRLKLSELQMAPPKP